MTNYTFLIEALLPVVNEKCADLLREGDKNALASWYDDIDQDGHLEVGRFKSASGNPVVLRFSAKNQDEIDAIANKIEAARKAGNDDLADDLTDTLPIPVWGA